MNLDGLKSLASGLLKGRGQGEPEIKHVLACDFGRSNIIFLEAEKTAYSLNILHHAALPRVRDQKKDIEALQAVREKFQLKKNRIRIAVKGQGVVVRFVQFPKMKHADLKSALAYEAEKYIPFKFHEVVLDYVILEPSVSTPSGEMMNVILVAVKQEEIYSLIQTFQAAGYEIELIDIDAIACLNALEFLEPEDVKQSCAFLDIGSDFSTISVLRNGKPRFIRDISYGGADIIKRMKRKLGSTEEDILKIMAGNISKNAEHHIAFKEAIRNLISDLQVSIEYYNDQIQGAEPLSKMFLGGGGSGNVAIAEILNQELGFPVKALEINDKVQFSNEMSDEEIKKAQSTLAVALGLCVRTP